MNLLQRLCLSNLRPPHGCEVRRLCGWLLFLIGAARALQIGVGPLPELTYTPLVFYGLLALAVGAGLLLTERGRLRLRGRLASVLAAAFCVLMVADFWPNATGVIIYGVLALSLFAEAGSVTHG